MSSQYLQGSVNQKNIDIRVNSISTSHLTVTQFPTINSNVTINSDAGTIVCAANASTSGSTTVFDVFNANVKVTDTILVSVNGYTGFQGTNGVPVVSAIVDTVGQFSVYISNVGNSNFNGSFSIRFQLIHV
jgi:hypothetical protein